MKKTGRFHRGKNASTNKKGIIDVQFNWIFILIAGFVIFIFIIGIVFSQKSNSEKQSDIKMSNQITTLLKGKQQTADVYSEINFPTNSLSFRCEIIENKGYFSFKISNSERTTLPTEIIFAPKEITTNKLIIWTQAFSLGFPINVYSYITTSDSIILILDDKETSDTGIQISKYARLLNESIPSNITNKILSADELHKYSSYKNKKIICFNEQCDNIILKNYDYLGIQPKGDLFDYGDVTFHKKGIQPIDAKLIPYITKAGLFGAIFSDTQDYYSCQMLRALNHYEIKLDLTDRRLTMIQNDTLNGNCKLNINVTLEDNIKPYKNLIFNDDDIKQLYQNTINLDIRNLYLTVSNCPKIY